MIVDFHTHVFPEKIAEKTIRILAEKAEIPPYTDGTTKGLLSQMEKGGVDVAVTLPVLTKPEQFDSVNRFAAEINETYRDSARRLISFGGVHPAMEDIDGKMRFLKEKGFLGVKIHPDYQGTFIDDPGYIRILEAAKEYDMIVVTHAGVDDGYAGQPVKCPPALAKKVIDRVKHPKFVLGHYGGHAEWEEVLDLLAGEDVYFDTAFTLHKIDAELFRKILQKHGKERVLFATDCPWRDMKEDVETLRGYGLGKDAEERIFSQNALDLLQISVK